MRFRGFASVFAVADVGAALDFYVRRMGFGVEFRMGDPPEYAIVERDHVQLHLMPAARAPESRGRSAIYVYTAGVDALHAELVGRGCPIEMPPEDFSYGMREASVRDPDGNRLTFGEEIVKPEAAPSPA
ncbi:MAG: bleomycin resistance protein [Alphaproteobacteria bacterium]